MSSLGDFFRRRCDLSRLSRGTKRLTMVAADLLLIPFALWAAFALRLGELNPPVHDLWWLFALAPLVSIPVFVRLGLYHAVVRFMGNQAVMAVLKGVALSTLLLAVVVLFSGVKGVPRSVYVIYGCIAVFLIGGSRYAMRVYFQLLWHSHANRERIAIYGSGESGVQLAAALANGREYEVIAFIDDNPSLRGSFIHNIRVEGPEALEKLIDEQGLSQVLLAMPSASHARRRAIVDQLEPLPIHVRTVPGTVELVSGKAQVDQIREVEIEDLLGRDTVPANHGLLDACIRGKSVMISGAGGSIGSELCRQIILLGPRRLVLFELSEYALYRIERELLQVMMTKDLAVELIPLLGSVQERERVEGVMRAFEVQTVYHAAAYKHVPLVEHNMMEGVRNNVFGTLHAAEAAIAAKVETFVLISTDKAVRPTNVMGASKRLAELVLQGLAETGAETRFCMVRFGNVLGSSGSVVPLFREQIHHGGPITVTHKDIVRFFMTIREAAELVIQAGSMGRGGDVFLLDMGEPVRIADMARKMIHLMGYTVRDEETPDGDIAIHYTGLRPGEKLYEELLIGENASGTTHPRIMRGQEVMIGWGELNVRLERLREICAIGECAGLREFLRDVVNGYTPSGEIEDLLCKRKGISRDQVSAEQDAFDEESGIAADHTVDGASGRGISLH